MVEKIKKRDGRVVDYDKNKIEQAIRKAFKATGKQVEDSKIKEMVEKIGFIANQKFLSEVPSVEQVQDLVETVLLDNRFIDTAKAYILYRQKRKELRNAKVMMGVDDDLKLPINSLKVLEGRYLQRDKNRKVIETPKQLFERVARNVATADKNYGDDPSISEKKFYDMMTKLEFLPNSPTLMNAGTEIQQLSACFVLPIEDSIVGIFNSVKWAALIHKSGGGTGFSFTRLRQRGAVVGSTGGIASGPISFMKVFNTATEVIKQGGKRRGANMGIIRVDHPDIIDFITAKEDEKELTNFNISVAVTEKFMKAVDEDDEYDLIDPKTKEPVNRLRARNVFDLMVTMAWKNGEPGIVFIDKMNSPITNPTPHVGEIESTNPCVVGDTLVSTDKGLMQIKEIKQDINILTDNRVIVSNSDQLLMQKTVQFQKIKPAFKTGIKETFKIETKSGYEVIATEDHKFMTDNGWKELKDLTIEDNILIQCGKGKFNDDNEIPFNSKYASMWNKELGQILGWVIGDGWLREGKDCRVGFVFGNKDEEVLKYLKPLINELYGRNIKEIKRKNNTTHLSYHSKGFVNFFMELGVKPVKADKKEVPKSLFTATEDAVKGFIQGLFTADGTISTNNKNNTNYIRLSSKSRKLLKQTQQLLLNLGIKSRIYERHRNKRLTFKYKNLRGEMKLYESDGILYELQISKNMIPIFMQEIGFLKNRHKEKTENFKKIKFYSTNFKDRVVAVEPNGKKEVYDLTEPLTHSFIANGMIVHNCGEQPLLPFESCNLGSINLEKFVDEEKKEINWEKLKETVHNCVHFLDNVIDVNKFPLQQIHDIVERNRKIGLGVMGWANMLIMLGIPYNSYEAVELGRKVMKFIDDEAKKKSVELAKKRGVFANFEGSTYDNGKEEDRVRNATRTTLAPTGTIGVIANTSGGIEPLFAISYIRKTPQFELLEVNPLFEKIAREKGFYDENLMRDIACMGSIQSLEQIPEDVRKLFVTTMDLTPEEHVKMQSAFQAHVNNAVSKTVNMPYSATTDDVGKVYMLAWKLGCKGCTIYRDGSRTEQVLNVKKKEKKEERKIEEKPQEKRETISSDENNNHHKNEAIEHPEGGPIKVDEGYSGGCTHCHL